MTLSQWSALAVAGQELQWADRSGYACLTETLDPNHADAMTHRPQGGPAELQSCPQIRVHFASGHKSIGVARYKYVRPSANGIMGNRASEHPAGTRAEASKGSLFPLL